MGGTVYSLLLVKYVTDKTAEGTVPYLPYIRYLVPYPSIAPEGCVSGFSLDPGLFSGSGIFRAGS
jgi:hypothetical protein